MKLIEFEKLHDWEVVNISTNRSKKLLTIEIIHPENCESKKIEFIDVFEMYISKIKLQNVILDVIVFEESCDSDYFKYCSKILNITDFTIFPEYCLIYFEPSVGAEIICVCREIIVS